MSLIALALIAALAFLGLGATVVVIWLLFGRQGRKKFSNSTSDFHGDTRGGGDAADRTHADRAHGDRDADTNESEGDVGAGDGGDSGGDGGDGGGGDGGSD